MFLKFLNSCIKLLIQYGANINIPNKNNETPLYLAEQNVHKNCIALLKSYGAESYGAESYSTESDDE